MKSEIFFRHLRRDSRGSGARLVLFVLSLAIGVAAVVSVAGFSEGLERGISLRARELLAADLAVRARTQIPDSAEQMLSTLAGVRTAHITELLTVVAVPPADDGTVGRSQLVELKAVGDGYPFYGAIQLESGSSIDQALDATSAVVAPELLTKLEIDLGDTLRIGGADFTVSATILDEPDRIATAFTGGPRVLITPEGLTRADLLHRGSRAIRRLLVDLPSELEDELDTVVDQLAAALPSDGRFDIETWRDAQPALREGLQQTDRYLGLAALMSLLIGGVGIAQTVRAWLASRMDAIAVLKSIGYRPREVLALYLGQAVVLGLVGSLVGAALGVVLQWVPITLLSGLLPTELLDPFQPAALARGLVLGLGVTLLFSLPPLLEARRVPPIRVLRRDAEPLPPGRMGRALVAMTLFAGVTALAAWQSRSIVFGALFAAAMVVAVLILGAAARGAMRLAVRPRSRAKLWFRQGLSALARPGAATVSATVALGLGTLIVLAMFLVERHLDRELLRDVPQNAPSTFLIDIQPDQWTGVEEILVDAGATEVDSVPVVVARLREIDGRPVSEIASRLETEGNEDEGDRWAFGREQRMTYLESIPQDNELIAGELWNDPERTELSIESDFADSLGVELGSEIIFDIQGVPISMTVTSLRKVDWRTFGINFFLIAEPGTLDKAPQHRIAAARVPQDREQEVQDLLAATYPNVT
ncbi:MAG: FtsX-like permease family protein, partial [Acidobacteriota bacterium]